MHFLKLESAFFSFFTFSRQFFSLQEQWPFFSVTTGDDHLFHGFYWLPHFPRVWPLVRIDFTIINSIPSLCIFTIQQVVGVVADGEETSQNNNAKRTPIHYWSLVPGGGLRGGGHHKFSDRYTPLLPTPDRGMLDIEFLSQETPWRRHARTPER